MAYHCPYCNSIVRNSDKFCQSCGAKLTDLPDFTSNTAVQSQGNVQAQAQFKEPEETEPIEVEAELVEDEPVHESGTVHENYQQTVKSKPNINATIGFWASLAGLLLFGGFFRLLLGCVGTYYSQTAQNEIAKTGESGANLAKAGYIIGIICIAMGAMGLFGC